MNNYYTKQTPLTASNVIVYGILASQGLGGGTALAVPNGEQQRLLQVPYETHANLPSFDQIGNVFSGYLTESIDQQFVEAVSNFYAQLIENQEPLGQEFERALHENLWDL